MVRDVSCGCETDSRPRAYLAFGSCEQEFSANSDGQIATQLLANADVTGLDGLVRHLSLPHLNLSSPYHSGCAPKT